MKILITSSGNRGYIVEYFKEILGDENIFVGNSEKFFSAEAHTNNFILTNKINSIDYTDSLIKLSNLKGITHILPLYDLDVFHLSKNYNRFIESGIIPLVSNFKTVDICSDKIKTIEFLKNNFDVPKSYTESKLLKSKRSEYLQYPQILKPQWGFGSKDIQIVRNLDELNFFLKYLKGNCKVNNFDDNTESEILIQDYIEGIEYNLDVINDFEGVYKNTIVKKKLYMRAGETFSAEIIDDEILVQLGQQIGQQLKHFGNLDVDVIRANNKNYIIDMNPRFGGGYPFSHAAGVNLPLAYVKWSTGEEFDEDLLKKSKNIVATKDMQIVIFSNDEWRIMKLVYFFSIR